MAPHIAARKTHQQKILFVTPKRLFQHYRPSTDMPSAPDDVCLRKQSRSAPGSCTIELHIPRKTPSVSVSADAVIFNAGGLQIAENGVVHLRKVSVVQDLGQEVEINSGVKAGDQVVLNPAVDLADGRKVRVRAPATRTS
jgi:hypothetical protein